LVSGRTEDPASTLSIEVSFLLPRREAGLSSTAASSVLSPAFTEPSIAVDSAVCIPLAFNFDFLRSFLDITVFGIAGTIGMMGRLCDRSLLGAGLGVGSTVVAMLVEGVARAKSFGVRNW
jgi:hypothetical protein